MPAGRPEAFDGYQAAEDSRLNAHADIAESGAKPLTEPASFWAWLATHIRNNWLLWLGMAALAAPTMASVARDSWSTEQGAHGPIVLATGIWLVMRQWRNALAIARPGSTVISIALLIPALLLYAFARVTNIVEIEGFAMYGALLAVLYMVAGGAVMRLLWFPLVYLLFVFPPPDTMVAMVTQPLKIWISRAAIDLLFFLGYPIAGSGVTIQIGQYQLLVAAACAGLNSLISLSAIGLFYVYIRHNANWRYAALLMFAIVPVAVLANFMRVLILVLITYHFGEAMAQGFIHNFAGVTMFAISVLGIFAVDALASPLRHRLEQKAPAQ
ncbi:MAG: exosortase V [Sphingomonadaceae bacterium]